MKTSELKEWLDTHGYEDLYVEGNGYIEYFSNLYNNFRVYTTNGELRFSSNLDERTKAVLCEYALTPLNEREDEKKYRIIVDNTFFQEIEYLTLISNRKKYYFSAFKNNEELYQRIFTQQEIDNLPSELKGAIECGFLRKVEVEVQ